MISKIKEYSRSIATLGPIGHLPIGSKIAALLAFPLFTLLGWIYLLSSSFFYFFFVALIIFIGLTVFFALRCEPVEGSGTVVINNTLGMLVTFICIPLTMKFAAIGFLLFYGAKFILPIIAHKVIGQRYELLPVFITLLGTDVVAGFSVNIFLQFVLWMAH